MGSPPFTLSPRDWQKLAVSAVLAILSGLTTFITGQFLPTLNDTAANEVGLLIVATLSTVLPFIANFLRKLLTDTRTDEEKVIDVKAGIRVTKPLVGLIAVGLCLAGTSTTYAAGEAFGAGPITGAFFDKLLADPMLLGIIAVIGCLVLSKLLKVDVTPFVKIITDSLLKLSTNGRQKAFDFSKLRALAKWANDNGLGAVLLAVLKSKLVM